MHRPEIHRKERQEQQQNYNMITTAVHRTRSRRIKRNNKLL